ncbi:thermonuclease family protein [Thalassospira marina]|uniref:Nuclease n=1 Tax=Thalassospira marina TaxID=2048283 RepID=A0ABN5FB23_9PROT|nr:thermonuclease family protein [Thalassospira marina]AUG51405.1 nuclease [Thalassospira marina]
MILPAAFWRRFLQSRVYVPVLALGLLAAPFAAGLPANAQSTQTAQTAQTTKPATPPDVSNQTAFEADGHKVFAIDGDTILIDGHVFDIAGIDAPELGQQCLHDDNLQDCGLSAGMQLQKYFIMSPFPAECVLADDQRNDGSKDSGQDGKNWPRVECSIGDRDIGSAMIADGEALPIPGFSLDYDDQAKQAANAGIGLFGTQMVPPAEWREGKRLKGEKQRCLFVGDGMGHYVSPLDSRFVNFVRKDAPATPCSDEEARQSGLEYLPKE